MKRSRMHKRPGEMLLGFLITLTIPGAGYRQLAFSDFYVAQIEGKCFGKKELRTSHQQ